MNYIIIYVTGSERGKSEGILFQYLIHLSYISDVNDGCEYQAVKKYYLYQVTTGAFLDTIYWRSLMPGLRLPLIPYTDEN